METAFLVRVSISLWTARKLDKSASRDTKERAGATDKAAVKVYKTLLAADELSDVESIASAARIEHRKRTVPWQYDGPGAITAAGYPGYKAAMDGYAKAFSAAVARFIAAYERDRGTLLSDASHPIRVALGKLFDPNDYPSPGDLRNRFAFHVSAEPMPQADDFRVQGLAPEHVAEIKRDIVEQNVNALQNANATAWSRVIEHVEKLKLRLSGYQQENGNGKLYGSLLDNIKELVEMLPSINVANDPELTRIGQKLVALTAYTIEDLRDDSNLRATVAQQAGLVLAQINEAYSNAA